MIASIVYFGGLGDRQAVQDDIYQKNISNDLWQLNWLEHPTYNRKVLGSIPNHRTKSKSQMVLNVKKTTVKLNRSGDKYSHQLKLNKYGSLAQLVRASDC